MLVAAAGNTALQSVMPAIGREIGISDFWVAVAYTWSAVLWVVLAPFWAEKSDHHGRKALTLLGLSGFIVSMLLCGAVLHFGLVGAIGGGLTFLLFGMFRAIYGSLGCATPSATQAYLASKTRRSGRVAALSALASSFGLGTIVGPAVAPLFVLPFLGLSGPLFAFSLIRKGLSGKTRESGPGSWQAWSRDTRRRRRSPAWAFSSSTGWRWSHTGPNPPLPLS